MPAQYALDTNVYIQTLRDPLMRAGHRRFVARRGSGLWLNGIVVTELRAGVRSGEQGVAFGALVAPFAERDRIVAPSFAACLEAGRVLADLIRYERYVIGETSPSIVRDALIATSCREQQVTVVTNNTRDFAAIQRHLRGFTFTPPWPS